MAENYRQQVEQEWEKYNNKAHYPNIMLLGATGCGKSSLINRVFDTNVAFVSDTGRGTTDFDIYYGEKTGMRVNLIDSMGFEMGDRNTLNEYINSIKNWIKKNQNKENAVHLIWYCVQVPNMSIQDWDAEVLRTIMNEPTLKDKVALVITKCDQDDEDLSTAKAGINEARRLVGKALPAFRVTVDKKFPLDLEKLVEWSGNSIDDEDVRRMFIASQMISLKEKRKQAALIVSGAALGAGAVGAIPIPFADAPILTAGQVAMSAGIIACYGLNMAQGAVKGLVGSVLLSSLGKSLVGSLAKLIPGVGSVINAAVAATITAALGAAISEISYACCKKIAKGETLLLEDAFSAEAIGEATKNFLQSFKNKSKDEITRMITIEADKED